MTTWLWRRPSIGSTPIPALATMSAARLIWVDGIYGRATTNGKFAPDFTLAPFSVSAANPYLSQTIRNQLATAGQTSFTFGRVFNDVFMMQFNTKREQKEGAIGIDGTFGKSFKYSAHYSHGEVSSYQRVENSRIAANLTKAINAVASGGQIVCAVNADAITTNDDPACRPLNPFGRFNASPESLAYVRGTQQSWSVSKLDAAGVDIQGDLFSLWAGPITVAVGAEARWEEQSSSRGAQDIAGVFAIPLYTSNLAGGFNVKEGFAEIAAPLLNVEGAVKVDFNAAARYSDYSNSGGIWAWKAGGTVRLFDDLLLRLTRSRDIRAPGIGDLFAVRRINVGPLTDQDSAGRTGIPGYNANPATVTTYSGGNPDLLPEISKTLDVRRHLLAVVRARAQPFGRLLRHQHRRRDHHAFRAEPHTRLQERQHRGVRPRDPQSRHPDGRDGLLERAEHRGLPDPWHRHGAFVPDAAVEAQRRHARLDPIPRAGHPYRSLRHRQWRHARRQRRRCGRRNRQQPAQMARHVQRQLSGQRLGVDLRARYVGGGAFNHLNTTLINNTVDSRTYIDLGVRFNVDDKFTLFSNVNNLFDVDPPISTVGNTHYDVVGRYFSFGARINF
jgi:iron complex outermembrane receptor protein